MKQFYFTFIFTLLATYVNAQIVAIPDANFKSRLIQLDIDTNSDGEIQETEAKAVKNLYLSYPYNIKSIEGIKSFTNLVTLFLAFNPVEYIDISNLKQLTTFDPSKNVISINASGCSSLKEIVYSGTEFASLDVSGCTLLTNLNLSQTALTTFNFTGCINLSNIYINSSKLDSAIDISILPNLENFIMANAAITSLNAQGCKKLQRLTISNNKVKNLNVAGCTALKDVYVDNNLITNLNLKGLTSLIWLTYNENPLITLDVSNCVALPSIDTWPLTTITNINAQGCTAMGYFDCNNNQLTTFNASGLGSLIRLTLHGNKLTDVNLAGCTSLTDLDLANNKITTVDVSDAVKLRSLGISNNNLKTLDVTQNTSLNYLVLDDNPIETLFIKNGIAEKVEISNCPNLYYICADELDFEYITNIYPDVNLNSYCTFVPGGVYNTVTGVLKIDNENNGCDSADSVIKNAKINIESANQKGVTYTNDEGVYTYYAGIEMVKIAPELDMIKYFSFNPESSMQNFTTLGNTTSDDFCAVPDGLHYDLDISIIPIFNARPGFDATYKLIINNKGNQIQSGIINLVFDDSLLDYVSSSQTPLSSILGILTWNFENILPFDSYAIDLTLNVNSPVEIPAVYIDDVLPFTTTIVTDVIDETPEDNVLLFNQVVVGSYDPNDKSVTQGAEIRPQNVTDYLQYTIRFQNTGTAEAINIVIKDMLANNLDWETFRPISASHSYRTTITKGNTAEFFFKDINLVGEKQNEPESHGYVCFKIKPKAGAVLGDVFKNTAEIYFDYNAPIITNTVTTTVAILGNQDFDFSKYFTVYPNPATDKITITANKQSTIKQVNMYNLLGQLVLSVNKENFGDNLEIALSKLQKGNYLLEVITIKGKSTQKIIKI